MTTTKPVAAVKVRENKQPNTTAALALRASDKYERILKSQAGFSGWLIAWARPDYAMIKSGRKGEWAAICQHGKAKRVAKGALAEQAGRDRRTWCAACKKG